MKRACAVVEVLVPESYNRFVAKTRSRDLTDREIYFFYWGIEFESNMDMSFSNFSISAAAFGKIAFADFAVMVYRGPRRS